MLIVLLRRRSWPPSTARQGHAGSNLTCSGRSRHRVVHARLDRCFYNSRNETSCSQSSVDCSAGSRFAGCHLITCTVVGTELTLHLPPLDFRYRDPDRVKAGICEQMLRNIDCVNVEQDVIYEVIRFAKPLSDRCSCLWSRDITLVTPQPLFLCGTAHPRFTGIRNGDEYVVLSSTTCCACRGGQPLAL